MIIKSTINWIIDNWKEITGILAGIWLLIKFGIKCYRWINSVVIPIKKWIRDINSALEQLKYDGGSSVKDMVYSTNKNVTVLIDKVELIMGRQIAVLHEIPTPMYECSPIGDLIDVNRAWCEMTGLDKKDAVGQGWKKIIANEDLAYVVEIGEDFFPPLPYCIFFI